jgi:peptidoglycan hydrolase CwlO-like protein
MENYIYKYSSYKYNSKNYANLMREIFLTFFYVIYILLFSFFSISNTLAQTTNRDELQKELKELETQIELHKKVIDDKKKESQTLQRDIGILDTKIKKTETEIKSIDKNIKNINFNIKEKEQNIIFLDKKLERDHVFTEETLRKMVTDKQDNMILNLLDEKDFGAAIDNVNALITLKTNLQISINNIKSTKLVLEETKEKLEEDKSEKEALKVEQVMQKQEIESNKKEKDVILKETKGQEKRYQDLLSNTQKRANEIRTALFSLTGSNQQINFGTALELAKAVEKQTGVRAAFILGIIRVESNLGKNVGTGNWKIDMHPTRDQPLFKTITDELGLDPDKQPVSKRAWYGYGGAMGPAQFIPSTWVGYKDKVSKLTGNSPANPWNPRDAFMASGLLLADNGATKGTRAAEHRAAVCYLAGCGNAHKKAYQFYGNDVMKYADQYEADINLLKNN